VFLAARGLRNLDAGDEAIDDAAARALLRRGARNLHLRAALWALGLTGFALLL
jgi:hypothetical protein